MKSPSLVCWQPPLWEGCSPSGAWISGFLRRSAGSGLAGLLARPGDSAGHWPGLRILRASCIREEPGDPNLPETPGSCFTAAAPAPSAAPFPLPTSSHSQAPPP